MSHSYYLPFARIGFTLNFLFTCLFFAQGKWRRRFLLDGSSGNCSICFGYRLLRVKLTRRVEISCVTHKLLSSKRVKVLERLLHREHRAKSGQQQYLSIPIHCERSEQSLTKGERPGQTTTKWRCTNSISRFFEWLISQQVSTPYP